MKLFRINHIGLLSVIAPAVSGCNQPSTQPIADQSKDIATLIASDMRNPDLSEAISKRLAKLREAGQPRDAELIAAGFERDNDTRADCARYRFQGKPRTRLGRDDTLGVHYRECTASGGGQATKLSVTFGDK